MYSRLTVLVSAMLVLGVSPAGAGEPAKPTREPIYAEDGKGMERVDQALVASKRENTRVLLTIGGNWCGWCYKLHDLFQKDATVRTTLRDEYELVWIDSRADKPVMERWKITPKAYPYLTVLDSAGRNVTEQETGSLEIGDRHDPNKVAAFLGKWKATPLDANDVFRASLAQAKKEGKRVFLRVGAPWCGWCRRLDEFLARPKIETILKKDYVVTKIDQQRMLGATEVIQKIRKRGEGGGIPWFAFLDKSGRILITSTRPGGGNIGFPVDPNTEIPHFVHMLRSTRTKITDADIELMVAELSKSTDGARR